VHDDAARFACDGASDREIELRARCLRARLIKVDEDLTDLQAVGLYSCPRSTFNSCSGTARFGSAWPFFLPANLIMGACSVGISAKLVMRFGIKRPLVVGLSVAAVGLALLARAPVGGHFLTDVLPSMILLGFGAGIAFNPVLLAAMSDVAPEESGLASGVVNTAFMMGGALGLAVLASIATSRTDSLRGAGHSALDSLVGGYHAAFLVGAMFAVAAASIGAALLRVRQQAAAPAGAHAVAEPG
jgi:MFS family permease